MANKIDITTVDQIAHLARLEFDENSKAGILNDMNRMLEFMDKLNELNTEHVQPLIYMTKKNAPKKDSDYFKAPKVLEQK